MSGLSVGVIAKALDVTMSGLSVVPSLNQVDDYGHMPREAVRRRAFRPTMRSLSVRVIHRVALPLARSSGPCETGFPMGPNYVRFIGTGMLWMVPSMSGLS